MEVALAREKVISENDYHKLVLKWDGLSFNLIASIKETAGGTVLISEKDIPITCKEMMEILREAVPIIGRNK